MSHRLYVRIPYKDEAIIWGIQHEDSNEWSHHGELSDYRELSTIAELAAQCQVIVVLPGQVCLKKFVKVPSKKRHHIIKAVPYLLEEQIIGHIDDQHFALGERNQSKIEVLVTEKKRLKLLLEQFAQSKIDIDYVLPDYSLLSTEHPSLWVGKYHAMIRLSEDASFSTQRELLLPLLTQLHEQEPEQEPQAWLINHDPALSDQDIAQLTQQLNDLGMTLGDCHKKAWLDQVADHFNPNLTNLLQGKFTPKGDFSNLWPKFKSTAALFAVALMAHLVYQGVVVFQLESKRDQLKQAINEVYREAFPNERRIVNVRAQMNSKLKELRRQSSEQGFLMLLTELSRGITDQTISTTGMSYSQEDMALRVELSAESLESIENFQQRLVEQGLSVELGSASAEGERYRGRLIITTAQNDETGV